MSPCFSSLTMVAVPLTIRPLCRVTVPTTVSPVLFTYRASFAVQTFSASLLVVTAPSASCALDIAHEEMPELPIPVSPDPSPEKEAADKLDCTVRPPVSTAFVSSTRNTIPLEVA